MSTSTKPVPVSVVLPPGDWERIRQLSITRRTSASAIVRGLIAAELRREDRRARATQDQSTPQSSRVV